MDTEVEVWEGEGGAPVATTEGAQNVRQRRAFWIGVLCAVTVVAVLAFRGKAVLRPA